MFHSAQEDGSYEEEEDFVKTRNSLQIRFADFKNTVKYIG